MIYTKASGPGVVASDGARIWQLLQPLQLDAAISIAEGVLPHGEESRRHYHKETVEIIYVLDGTGFISVGNEGRTIGKGDCIVVPKESLHFMTSGGSVTKDLRVLAICSPPWREEDTFYMDRS